MWFIQQFTQMGGIFLKSISQDIEKIYKRSKCSYDFKNYIHHFGKQKACFHISREFIFQNNENRKIGYIPEFLDGKICPDYFVLKAARLVQAVTSRFVKKLLRQSLLHFSVSSFILSPLSLIFLLWLKIGNSTEKWSTAPSLLSWTPWYVFYQVFCQKEKMPDKSKPQILDEWSI